MSKPTTTATVKKGMMQGRPSSKFTKDQRDAMNAKAETMYRWLDTQDRSTRTFSRSFTTWKQDQALDLLENDQNFRACIPVEANQFEHGQKQKYWVTVSFFQLAAGVKRLMQ
jgi:hypothetical protein